MLEIPCGRQGPRHRVARRHAGALVPGAAVKRIHTDRRPAFTCPASPKDESSAPGTHAGDPRNEPASRNIDPRVAWNAGSEPNVSRNDASEAVGEAASEDHYEALQEASQSHGQPVTAGSWTALFMLPAALWGACWFMTAGTSAGAYASLACAAAIARDAFGGLVASSGGAAAPGAAASAAASAASAVDWPDLAMRTAAGMAAGGSGRDQVLQALQDAGAHPVSSWAVQAVLPALCGTWRVCRSTALGLQEGPLGAVLVLGSQLGAVAAGLGVLVALALPLRPYLAPLLPIFPKARPTPSTQLAAKAGGAACMVAILTLLQSSELAPPSLAPARGGLSGALPGLVPGSSAYGAAGLGGAGGSGPFWYSCVAVTGDVVVPLLLCGAAVAAATALWRGRGLAERTGATAATDGRGGRAAEGSIQPAGALRRLGSVVALRAALDCVLLLLAATGQLGGRVSAMHVLGTLWLLQALWNLRQQPGTGAPATPA